MWDDAARALESARALSEQVAAAAQVMARALDGGGKILVCGNGGSAADGLHFSGELLNKFRRVRRPLAAVCLAADVSTITSIANDESYDMVFAKQVEALGRRGDVLVVITTSGNSPNIMRAAAAARTAGLTCIALNGKDGGALSNMLRDGGDGDGDDGDGDRGDGDGNRGRDIDIIAPGDSTARIQEIHAIIIHAFCELIDLQLFGES
ncbi:MAG: SIS domain-containing protein [Gammaproteobacteria bacterium]|nr:SIS domain-containing protein [Gammaproteobacteria bacterium]